VLKSQKIQAAQFYTIAVFLVKIASVLFEIIIWLLGFATPVGHKMLVFSEHVQSNCGI